MKMHMDDYKKIKPKQFGHIHERLKFLVSLTNKHQLPSDVHHAIYDLERVLLHKKN